MTAVAGAAPDNRRGVLLLASAAALFTLEVIGLRLLGDRVSLSHVLLFRSLAQVVFAGAWVWAAGGMAMLRTGRPAMHLLRSGLSLVMWWLYYASFARLELALATVLTFTSSLYVVAAAGPLMGERVGPLRAVATVVGFVGIVVASGVGWVEPDPAVLLGVAAAVAGAAIVLANRRLSATEATPTIMFYIGLMTLFGTAPVSIAGWTPLAAADALVLAGIGLAACLGMWMTIEAYRSGEVSALAPVPYLRLFFSALAGVTLFAEPITLHLALGATLIVASATMVARAR